MMPGAVVEVVAGPSSLHLVELSAVKKRLGIPLEDPTWDAELTRQLMAVGDLYALPVGLGHPPWRQRYRETVDQPEGLRVYLAAKPVESVTVWQGLERNAADELDGVTIEDPDRRSIYRAVGWPGALTIEYVAGWLMPDQVADWQPSTQYSAGRWVRVVERPLLRFETLADGASAAAPPAWPVVAGEEIADGDQLWV